MARKSYQETCELEDLERRIAELEKPMRDNPSDYVLIQELDTELQRLNAKLEHDMERWAELATPA